MYMKNLEQELKENGYPGRGIVIGESKDGKTAVTAYFIMGRSSNKPQPCICRRWKRDPHPGI